MEIKFLVLLVGYFISSQYFQSVFVSYSCLIKGKRKKKIGYMGQRFDYEEGMSFEQALLVAEYLNFCML